MSFFAADDLGVSFGGIRAVDGVSFTVDAGQVFTIIGPNGAGKTTIFNLVSRIYDPTDGRLSFRDEDITRVPAHEIARRGIASSTRSQPLAGAARWRSASGNVRLSSRGFRARGRQWSADWLPVSITPRQRIFPF